MFIICYIENHTKHYERTCNIETFKKHMPHANIEYIFDTEYNLVIQDELQKTQFATFGPHYGFTESDYKRRIIAPPNSKTPGHIMEFVNIKPNNRRYPCIVQDVLTSKMYKVTPDYIKQSQPYTKS